MSVPSVTVRRQDGQTGVVRPSSAGVLAIIAAATAGTTNVASSWMDVQSIATQYTSGPLVEDAAYVLNVAQKPVLLIACNATTVGTYGTIYSLANGGTSVVTAGATAPVDEFNVLVNILSSGTIGVTGITYNYSLDGGNSTSGTVALGTANSIVIPSSGVTLLLGSGTLAVGGKYQVFTIRPQPNTADITTALEALRVTKNPWESVYIDVDATSSMLTLLDAWLSGLETVGQFQEGALNIRHKLRPVSWVPSELAFASVQAAPIESETVYAASAAVTGFSAVSSIRCIVGADAFDVTSTVTGYIQPRQVALGIMAQAMAIPIGQDPAFGGPATNAVIADAFGNPKWHDEYLYPNLDSLRFSTMCSRPQESGAFITNANLFSSSGSDYVYLQQARVMNASLTLATQLLRTELSKGVRKQKADAVTGAVYILEADAAAIEGYVNSQLTTQLAGQVVGAQLVLSRIDDLGSNAGATVHASVEVEALAYIKNFAITAKFVRSLTVTV